MNLQEMTIEELKVIQEKISQEMKIREEKETNDLTDEFLKVWKKMEKLGFKLKAEEISSYTGNTGKPVKELQIEINGNLVHIYH